MTAKHSDHQEPSAPPCFVPVAELKAEQKKNGRLSVDPWKILGWLMNFAAGIALAVGTYAAAQLRDVDTRVIRIESSRFTAENGREVWKEIAEIKQEIARLPSTLPPPWFVKRVDQLEDAIKANAVLFSGRMDSLQADLRAHMREKD
jgi:hypothetical protein